MTAITFIFHGRVITYGAGAWSNRAFGECQQEIREMVVESSHREVLRGWFESKTKLALTVRYYLGGGRCDRNDLDNLLQPLFNPIVHGAYGIERPPPGPVQADALFWRLSAVKIKDDEDERVEIEIEPLVET